jgi:predicted secreted acid phosphatase
MADSQRVFQEITTAAALHASTSEASPSSSSHRPLAIFDLDSTIFNVSPRTQKILNTFLTLPNTREKYPQEVEYLRDHKVQHTEWGLKQSIERTGLPQKGIPTAAQFGKELRDFWRKNFFSSDFLHEDRPYEGAVEYVCALAKSGVEILYLTGRDEPNMRRGTLVSLKHWGLPLENERSLIMKPIKGTVEDEDFKDQQIAQIRKAHKNIWFFENEPLIIAKVLISAPEVKIVWIDTTHSGKAQPPTHLPTIRERWHK